MNSFFSETADYHVIDSHAHLDMEEFDADRNAVIQRAFDAGVHSLLCPADVVSDVSLSTTLNILAEHPSLFAAAGVHPHQAKDFSEDHLQKIAALHSSGRIVALGEIGLDGHYHISSPEDQHRVFRIQLRLAEEIGLPVIIHSRLAGPQIIASLKEEHFSRGGILHCFTEDLKTAEEMIGLGFLISFSGILTFPKAAPLRDVAARIPPDRLLVETDSPYLAPVPYRAKKRNEPAFVVETAAVLAGLKKVSPAELAEITTHNFFRLFGGSRTERPL